MRNASSILLPVTLLGFVALLTAIVLIPVETGDAYPPYSTLRADPLGAKILHDSLALSPGLRVERNFKPRLPAAENVTIFQLGANGPAWYNDEALGSLKEYESSAAAGARVVIAFLPQLPALDANLDAFRSGAQVPKGEVKRPEVETRWGVKFRLRKASAKERAKMDRMPIDSALFFVPDASWKVLSAARSGEVREIEKAMGKGSIVLVARSFPLSNEGLRDAPETEWVSGLVGSNKRVVFDESRLGIVDTGSIGTLIRRYRLQGSVAVLLLVGMLFIWRNAGSLLPAREEAADGRVAGRDAREGMASLLRRSVAKGDLLSVCRQEWWRTLSLRPGVARTRLDAVQQLQVDDAVSGYKDIHRILTERK